MTYDDRHEQGAAPHPAGLDPIGRALRSTYDAENHDSLGKDLTGLMLELARVDPGLPIAAPPPPPPPPQPASPPSLLRRLLFGRPAD